MGLPTRSQSLDKFVSEIFFQVNLSTADTSVLSVFKTNKKFKYIVQEGWTSYGPLAFSNDTPRFYNFEFTRNSFFDTSFKDGKLTLITRTNKDTTFLYSIYLGVTTFDLVAADSTYNLLSKRFKSLMARNWNQNGLDSLHKIINFLNKEKTKRVALAKHYELAAPLTSKKKSVHISISMIYL